MEIVYEPFAPWHWVVTSMVLVVTILVLARGIKDRWRVFGRRTAFRSGAVTLTILGGLLFLVASWNPVKRPKPGKVSIHMVIVIDGSRSVRKAQAGLDEIRNKIFSIIPGEESSPDLVVSLVAFAAGEKGLEEKVKLQDAISRLKALEWDDFPSADATNIEAGLRRAKALIHKSGGVGMILLCSDGHQTGGDAKKEAEVLGREGIQLHVTPAQGQRSPIRLSAVYLPAAVKSGATYNARVVVKSEAADPVPATLGFAQNAGLGKSALFGEELSTNFPTNVTGKTTLFSAIPVGFKGLGLQYFDANMTAGTKGFDQRRLFTLVTRPPQVLSVGSDHRWTTAISKKSALIQKRDPTQLNSGTSLEGIDAMVINTVRSSEFSKGALTNIVHAVENMGMGLMLVNGGHKPAEPTDPTVLMSYTNSPLNRILPVSTKPRPFTEKPPPRQVFILIDASGSMAGGGLECAKNISKYIVETLLRPEDALDLIAFSDTDTELLSGVKMNQAGKRNALAAIDGILIGGGTDPTSALMRIAQKKIKNGGMIFLSDGGFSPSAVSVRPDCKTMVFEIGVAGGNTAMLKQLGEVFPVPSNFNPAGIKMPYFEPEKRTNYFTFGKFKPASMKSALGRRALFDPGLEMEGTAVSYVREEAQLAFVRPKLTDPLLAYRTAANGEVGVLTTAFPDEWISDSKGKKAITDWVMRLIPFSERDRYMINIKDQGRDMQLEITLASPPGAKKPQVKAFNCFVRLRTTGVEIPVRIIPSTAPVGPDFTGKITVPRAGSAQEAHLFIEETKGEGAMGRKQRIPIVIPPTLGKVSQSKQEDEAFGVNEVLLKELAVAGNGRYLDPPGRLELPVRQGAVNIKDPLWPFLFLGGLTFYVCAFVLQRLDP